MNLAREALASARLDGETQVVEDPVADALREQIRKQMVEVYGADYDWLGLAVTYKMALETNRKHLALLTGQGRERQVLRALTTEQAAVEGLQIALADWQAQVAQAHALIEAKLSKKE